MANFITNTARQLRQPLAFFGAFAAGCLAANYAAGQDSGAKLDQLFTAKERIEFKPVPKMEVQAPKPVLQTPTPVFNPPFEKGPSVRDFFGELNQPARSAEKVKAKMVLSQIKEEVVPMQERVPAPARSTPSFTRTPSAPKFSTLSAENRVKPRRVAQPTYSQQPTYSPQQPIYSAQQAGLQNRFQQKQNYRMVESSQPRQEAKHTAQLATFNEPAYTPTVYNRTYGPIENRAEPKRFSQMPLTRSDQNAASYVARRTPAYRNPRALTGIHRLKNVDMNRFETVVVNVWGNRLKTTASEDGRFVRVELPTNVRDRLAMMVDRQDAVITFEGGESLKDNWHNLMDAIDSLPQRRVDGTVEQTVLFDSSDNPNSIRQVAFLMGVQEPEPIQLPAGVLPPNEQETQIPAGTQGIKGTVRIISDPETGSFRVIGDPEDTKIIISTIEKLNKDQNMVKAEVESIPLKNLQSEAVLEKVQTLYDQGAFAAANGPVQIQALQSPNSLIVLGQKDAIESVKDIVRLMDVEAPAGEAGGFKTFRLKYMSAADAAFRLNSFFGQTPTGGGVNVLPAAPVAIVPDFRSNTVVVKGSVQFIQQAEQFLKTIDIVDIEAVNEVKVIPLRNTLASDMAVVIQDAINGQQQNAGLGANPNNQGQQGQTQQVQPNANSSSLRSSMLSLKTIDRSGNETNGGVMFDVRVTADSNSNSLVVTGPEESLELVEALVKQLDRLPNAETQIKVFEIVNGEAQTLLDMLEALFGANQQNQQQGQAGTNLNQLPLQGSSGTDGQTLVNLRFSIDPRSNAIIASGPSGDLQVVEDLLNRLDAKAANDSDAQIYRLSNAPAQDVADAIDSWQQGIDTLAGNDPRLDNGVTLGNRTVIVVPETVSNSLIVTARPEARAEVERIIRALDRRPPMVKVKVLIAEVDLNTLEEFGVELGVQDSLLFDRGTTLGAGGNIVDGIGFPFNSQTAPNLNAISPGNLAGQALSNLGTGRINSDLGYGGLVLSAGNESINVLLRALKDRQCVRVLSKPHIVTLENLQGRVSIGSNVPRVSGTTINGVGNVTQDITFVDVGVILEVTPRVSPDGMIVMAVNVQNSAVGPDETGITIGFGANGEPILAPQLIETEANTTLMARSGQTVVFSGLIQEEKTHIERGAPILSDLPVIGPLFKFESDSARRTELLIFMTPILITDDVDINAQNYEEMDRMNWCDSDVAEVYGNTQYDGYNGHQGAAEVYYPDADPIGNRPVMPEQSYEQIDIPQPAYEEFSPQSRARRREDGQPDVRQASFDSQERRADQRRAFLRRKR